MVIFQTPGSSRSAMAGGAVGGSLGEALQFLAQSKAQEMAGQKQAQAQAGALEALGLSPELGGLHPSLAKELLSQQGKQQQLAQLQSLLGAGAPGEEEAVVEDIRTPFSDEQILAASTIDPQLGRLLQSQKEASQREKLGAFKETKDIRKELREEAKSAKENVARLDRMQELVEKGELTNPALFSALKKFGLDMPVLMSPDSQEFEKLTVDFLRGARQIFGARVTNFEAQQFLRSIPSLMQTEEGKKRVIRNIKTLAQGAEIRSKEARKIIKENKGVPPLDLAEQVEERAEPKLERVYERFSAGIGPNEASVSQTVAVVLPDGRRGMVPRDRLKDALKAGAKRE